jgi:transposase-like protein
MRGDTNLRSRLSMKKEYRMDYEVKNVKMDNEFKICPTCGYKDGFHSMFKKDGDITKWLFICPSCHHIFDIGFTV